MRAQLKIKGMHCKSCAKLIEDKLADKANHIKVDFEKGFALIDFDKRKNFGIRD